jgi:hypothetical protein
MFPRCFPVTAARLCPPNFRLCLSLDMNVLPPTPTLLVDRVLAFARAKCGRHQLRRDGRAVLSTFGGGGLELEGGGWKGVKKRLKEVGEPVRPEMDKLCLLNYQA